MSNEKEKAYNDWEAIAGRTIQEAQAWVAGWHAAFESRPAIVETIRTVARQVEHSEIQKRIRDLAVAAFKAANDEEARIYRELADHLFGKPV